MKQEKQIEEMANIIAFKAFEQAHLDNGDEDLADIVATDLYEQGYRKVEQGEWAMPIKGSIRGIFGCSIECQNPNKVWKHNSTKYKQRTNPKCRLWQPKVKGE